MKTRPWTMPCLLLPSLLLLAACQTTRIESRPTGTYTDCDPALVGSWQATQLRADGNIDTLGTLDIPAGCQPIIAHKSGKPAEKLDQYDIGYVRVGPLHLLVGRAKADKGATDKVASNKSAPGKDTPGKDGDKPPGMLVFRYVANPQHIAVYGIDHALVARRIVDGTLSGQTNAASQLRRDQAQASNTVIESLIKGDGDTIATVLQAEPTLFSTQPVLMLQRVPAKDGNP